MARITCNFNGRGHPGKQRIEYKKNIRRRMNRRRRFNGYNYGNLISKVFNYYYGNGKRNYQNGFLIF